jgi:ATP dependent DNA ligase domain
MQAGRDRAAIRRLYDPVHADMPYEVTVIKGRRFPGCRDCKVSGSKSPMRRSMSARSIIWKRARLDNGVVRLLTRTGLDWTRKYPSIAAAVSALGARQAYLDGELCGVFPDGITGFTMIRATSDAGNAAGLAYFIFDLLHLDGDDVGARPLIERKASLSALLSGVAPPLHYSDYHRGRGPTLHAQACKLEFEGIVPKLADAPYAPGISASNRPRPRSDLARWPTSP